jgi:glutamine synthetase
MKPAVVKIFEKHKVLNERELHARYEVALETYIKTLNVEAQLMVLMANRYILPTAFRYQTEVAASVAAVKAAGAVSCQGQKVLTDLTELVDALKSRADTLANLLDHNGSSALEHARHMRDEVVPAMAALREAGDALELMCPHETWPLPTYREMLFVK